MIKTGRKKEVNKMSRVLFLLAVVSIAGCLKAPPPYIAAPDARPELPDAGEEELDASLPEAGDSGVDAGADTDGGE